MALSSLTRADLPVNLTGFSILTLTLSPGSWLQLMRIGFVSELYWDGESKDFVADATNVEICRHKDDPFYSTRGIADDCPVPHHLLDLGMVDPHAWMSRSFRNDAENLRVLSVMVSIRDIAGYATLTGISLQNIRAYVANATAQYHNAMTGRSDEQLVH